MIGDELFDACDLFGSELNCGLLGNYGIAACLEDYVSLGVGKSCGQTLCFFLGQTVEVNSGCGGKTAESARIEVDVHSSKADLGELGTAQGIVTYVDTLAGMVENTCQGRAVEECLGCTLYDNAHELSGYERSAVCKCSRADTDRRGHGRVLNGSELGAVLKRGDVDVGGLTLKLSGGKLCAVHKCLFADHVDGCGEGDVLQRAAAVEELCSEVRVADSVMEGYGLKLCAVL